MITPTTRSTGGGSWTSAVKFYIWNKKMLLIVLSVLVPALLPLVHLGVIYKLWDKYTVDVDKEQCRNDCWDTAFKGPYERGVGHYKHVFFNVTSNTAKIWLVTVFAIVALYETIYRMLSLMLSGSIRYTMLCLLLCVVYPHYYSWYSAFNYWNDDFYKQWNHQLFFSSTEIASTLMVIHLLNRDVPVTAVKLLVIIDIAILHILASGWDQFFANIVNGQGKMHQVLRDVGFMFPDLLHVVLPMYELRLFMTSPKKQKLQYVVSSGLFIFFGWVVCVNL